MRIYPTNKDAMLQMLAVYVARDGAEVGAAKFKQEMKTATISILRYPEGWSAEEVRFANAFAAELLEQVR
jgi:hypothetical protein